jgi:hypothetical protein
VFACVTDEKPTVHIAEPFDADELEYLRRAQARFSFFKKIELRQSAENESKAQQPELTRALGEFADASSREG